MKSLKFWEPLPGLILDGKKTTTWRINDEKNIKEGDELSLTHKDGTEFAKAIVLEVKETTFGKFTDEDTESHEEFSSNKELYATYSKYYQMKVTPETEVKVIKFKLLLA